MFKKVLAICASLSFVSNLRKLDPSLSRDPTGVGMSDSGCGFVNIVLIASSRLTISSCDNSLLVLDVSSGGNRRTNFSKIKTKRSNIVVNDLMSSSKRQNNGHDLCLHICK